MEDRQHDGEPGQEACLVVSMITSQIRPDIVHDGMNGDGAEVETDVAVQAGGRNRVEGEGV